MRGRVDVGQRQGHEGRKPLRVLLDEPGVAVVEEPRRLGQATSTDTHEDIGVLLRKVVGMDVDDHRDLLGETRATRQVKQAHRLGWTPEARDLLRADGLHPHASRWRLRTIIPSWRSSCRPSITAWHTIIGERFHSSAGSCVSRRSIAASAIT